MAAFHHDVALSPLLKMLKSRKNDVIIWFSQGSNAIRIFEI